MSEQKSIRNFWMIFIACLALLVIVMAIATATLDVVSTQNADPTTVRASIPGGTPLTMPAPAPWYKRAGGWTIGFLMAAILSGRFILLMGVLLFYGFIIAYIAPDALKKIRGRVFGKAGNAAVERVPTSRTKK
jgi:hypothetical protein